VNTAENKRVAAEFFARFDANDVAGALALMAEDMNWWIAGKPDASPAAGNHTKEQMAQMFRRMGSQLRDGLRMKVKGLIAEGDRVAVEAESRGGLRNGRVYAQQYHMLMTIRGCKIAEVKEYLDTHHVIETWFRPETASA
jgi:ketosteroid isomerase-like protein